MHKGVVLLTKADTREDALANVETFMENYGEGKVWDWYTVGGRWHNALAPNTEGFYKLMHEKYPFVKDGMYSIDKVENSIDKPIIQEMWESLGLKGKNPYYSSYGFDGEDTQEDYNVVPLKDCLQEVKLWVRDIKEDAEKLFLKIVEAREDEKNKPENKYNTMSAYYAGLYKDVVYNNFCFESNVYNCTKEEGESIPENIEEYWAVMVDMHN